MEILLSPEKNHQFNVPQFKKIRKLFERKNTTAQNICQSRIGYRGLLLCPREAGPRSFPKNLRKNRSLGNEKIIWRFFWSESTRIYKLDRSEDFSQHAGFLFFQRNLIVSRDFVLCFER